MPIGGNGWQSAVAISGRNQQWQSAVAISGGNHSQSAVAIRGNQRSSDVITGHQAHLIREDEIEQTRSPALQLVTLTKHVRLDRRDIPRGEEQSERLLDDLAFSSAPVAIRGTQQWQSVAINGTQWHSVALSSAPVAADSLDAFRVETRRCMLVLVHVAHVPIGISWQSVAIRGHLRPSEAIRGHPRPSEAILGHHLGHR